MLDFPCLASIILPFSGSLAQLVEHRTFNPLVVGSSPTRPTTFRNGPASSSRSGGPFRCGGGGGAKMSQFVAIGEWVIAIGGWALRAAAPRPPCAAGNPGEVGLPSVEEHGGGKSMSDEPRNRAVFQVDEGDVYRGPERRVRERRVLADRREMVRFEPDKKPRRSGKDRRAPLSVWDGREKF